MPRRSTRRLAGRTIRLIIPEFPGVDPAMWTDLPPAAYPPSVAELIRGVLDARQTGEILTVNGFRCDRCGLTLVTRDLHPGVSPQYVDHRRFTGAPGAELCPGLTRSLDYPRHVDFGAPSHEWYRPGELALLGLAKDLRHGERFINHVLRGGLLLRPIPTGATP